MKTLIINVNKLKDLIIYNSTFHIKNSVVSKHNPITILLALGTDAGEPEKKAAKEFVLEIIGYIKEGYSESQIIDYMSNELEIEISPKEILYAIGSGLESKVLSITDLCKDFYINPLSNMVNPSSSSSSSSLPSPSSSLPSPSSSSSSSSASSPSPSSSLPDAPDKSILSSIGTYVSEHKLLIIGSIAVAAVVGTVIYILWKRRGRTPPTGQESIPSSESDQNSTPSTSDVIAKIVYIVISLTVLYSYTYFINHAI